MGLRGAVALCLLWVIRHATEDELCGGEVPMRPFLIWLLFPMWYGMSCNIFKGLPDMAILPYMVWNSMVCLWQLSSCGHPSHAIWNGHKGHPDMALFLHVKYGMASLPVVEWLFCSACKTCYWGCSTGPHCSPYCAGICVCAGWFPGWLSSSVMWNGFSTWVEWCIPNGWCLRGCAVSLKVRWDGKKTVTSVVWPVLWGVIHETEVE